MKIVRGKEKSRYVALPAPANTPFRPFLKTPAGARGKLEKGMRGYGDAVQGHANAQASEAEARWAWLRQHPLDNAELRRLRESRLDGSAQDRFVEAIGIELAALARLDRSPLVIPSISASPFPKTSDDPLLHPKEVAGSEFLASPAAR